jgi:hemerythrin-like domain-containing protein
MIMRSKGLAIARKSTEQAPAGIDAPPRRTTTTRRLVAHDVVSALQAEHRYASLLLDLLEERLAATPADQPLDREAFLAGMGYMTQHLDGYHHLREDAMFARLVKRAPDLAKPIARVKREHRSIGSAGKRLLVALERPPRVGRSAEAGLISGIADYVSAMRAHMGLEERELFPRARQLLDEEDRAEIDRAFIRVIDPIFEASIQDAYAAYSPIVRHLAERPAVRQVVGALNGLFDSALTLGETIFGAGGQSARTLQPGREEATRRASPGIPKG